MSEVKQMFINQLTDYLLDFFKLHLTYCKIK